MVDRFPFLVSFLYWHIPFEMMLNKRSFELWICYQREIKWRNELNVILWWVYSYHSFIYLNWKEDNVSYDLVVCLLMTLSNTWDIDFSKRSLLRNSGLHFVTIIHQQGSIEGSTKVRYEIVVKRSHYPNNLIFWLIKCSIISSLQKFLFRFPTKLLIRQRLSLESLRGKIKCFYGNVVIHFDAYLPYFSVEFNYLSQVSIKNIEISIVTLIDKIT